MVCVKSGRVPCTSLLFEDDRQVSLRRMRQHVWCERVMVDEVRALRAGLFYMYAVFVSEKLKSTRWKINNENEPLLSMGGF
jgi:hypothetical protein